MVKDLWSFKKEVRVGRAFHLALFFFAAFSILSCGKGDHPPEPGKPGVEEVAITGIIPEVEKVLLIVGGEFVIEYSVIPSDATSKEVQITTEQPSIISIKGKVIKALSVGSATVVIKSKSNQVKASIEIQVEPTNPTHITLDKDDLKMYVGQNESITAQVMPENTTDRGIIWTSLDPTTVKVSEEGEVEALRVGTTEIVASTKDGTIKSKAKISVLEDIAFITGKLKFSETKKDGKKHVTMETWISNMLNVDFLILAVEGYFEGKLRAVDFESFTAEVGAGMQDQIVNQFLGTVNSMDSNYANDCYTKVYFTLKGLTYCLTTTKNEATIVKVQSHTVVLSPEWDGESKTTF